MCVHKTVGLFIVVHEAKKTRKATEKLETKIDVLRRSGNDYNSLCQFRGRKRDREGFVK